MLPIGRTVVMKYPDVTRAISAEICQACNREMAKSAVQTKSEIDGGIGLRQLVRKVRDVEYQIHPRKAGEISGRQPCPLYLRLGDVKSTRGDAVEPERTRAHDQPA